MRIKLAIQKLNIILKLVLALLLSSIVGIVLLVLVYLLPVNIMNKHITSSVYFFEREGGAFQVTNGSNGQLDGSTDALMLLEAAYDCNGTNPLVAAMESRYSVLEETSNPAISLVKYYKGDYDKSKLKVASYGRYWHGYLVFLKPLLFLCNYGDIRLIVASMQIVLVMIFMYLAYIKCRDIIIPMVAFWISLNPLATMMSLQYNTIFMITLVASIVVLMGKDKWSRDSRAWFLLFELVGIATSYFDFLTYPIVSLGIPLLIWYYLFREELKTDMIRMIGYSVCYGFGYVGMWGAKWIIGSIVTRDNIIANAFDQVRLRSSDSMGQESISWGILLKKQVEGFVQYPVIMLLLVGFILILAIVIRRKDFKPLITNLALPLMVGLYPFIWFTVTKNHCYIHPYITCRELSITVFALGIYTISVLKKTTS